MKLRIRIIRKIYRIILHIIFCLCILTCIITYIPYFMSMFNFDYTRTFLADLIAIRHFITITATFLFVCDLIFAFIFLRCSRCRKLLNFNWDSQYICHNCGERLDDEWIYLYWFSYINFSFLTFQFLLSCLAHFAHFSLKKSKSPRFTLR